VRLKGKTLKIVIAGVAVLAAAGVLIHLPATHHLAEHLHSMHSIPEADHAPGQNGVPDAAAEASARARAGVAAIGRRWDAAAFAETVELYTAVHRELEWPGVLEPETIHYGPAEQQTFDLYRPEQGFSEPGPVLLFMEGNGLGDGDRVAPGSDGLIYGHLGKLAATFGGIGLVMSYRTGAGSSDSAGKNSATLAAGAEDLRLMIEWAVAHVAPYGGDPNTIVLLANSDGATRAAAYLFDEDLQTSSGPYIAAAVLTSGRFGALAPEITAAVDAYRGESVPLSLWSGELDTAEIKDGIAALHEQLCEKYGECPPMTELGGHNHVSHVLSLGTPDTSVAEALIQFYHTVR